MSVSRINGEITVNLEKVFELLPKSFESSNILKELSEFLIEKYELPCDKLNLGQTCALKIDDENSHVIIEADGEGDICSIEMIALGLAEYFEGEGNILIKEIDIIGKSESILILENKILFRRRLQDVVDFHVPITIEQIKEDLRR